MVDCQRVHERVIAYDKARFRAWREAVKRRPIPLRELGGGEGQATYDQAMARFYVGWGNAHERQLQHWLNGGI